MASQLDLSHLPPTFLLSTHLTLSQTAELTAQLRACKCPLASCVSTAALFLADINTAKRSEFELRGRGLKTESPPASGARIRVVKLKWLTESLAAGAVMSMDSFMVYVASVVSYAPPRSPEEEKAAADEERRSGILERARRDAARNRGERGERGVGVGGRNGYVKMSVGELLELSKSPKTNRRPGTPEFEDGLEGRTLEDMPEWVRKKIKYSCCRPTPAHSPNAHFISQLRKIRLSRILTSDAVGANAYSTFIAALQAHPYPLRSGTEVALLPGCGTKASALFHEWLHSSSVPSARTIKAVRDLEATETFRTLRTFHAVHGVDALTAHDWHYSECWRSLDDVVEHGWSGLSRAHQIGIKYHDEFQQTIPRKEVERIGGGCGPPLSSAYLTAAEIIGRYATILRPGMEYTLTGAYRRGEDAINDISVVLSHRSVSADGVARELVAALEVDGWITHTLHLGREMEDPDEECYDCASDPLEKAMVVWQEVEGGGAGRKNKNIHRRVDIVFAPVESVGTALLAWTGASTFVRDLREWCEKRRWLFTSKGVFEEGVGCVRVKGVDSAWRAGERMEDAEKRVFEGLGLNWIVPEDRCTG